MSRAYGRVRVGDLGYSVMAARGRQLLVVRGQQLYDDFEMAVRVRQLLVVRERQLFDDFEMAV